MKKYIWKRKWNMCTYLPNIDCKEWLPRRKDRQIRMSDHCGIQYAWGNNSFLYKKH
jgi:hypothetical protein